MKKALLLLALIAFALSPLMVTQAEAAPVKHRLAVRHHRKLVRKHPVKRLARHHRAKVAV
jgi:hypothetical protein